MWLPRNPAPGRPRAAVRPYYEGPPSLAGRGADEGGRKPAGSGAQQGPVRARKLRPRGQKSRCGAPRGARAPDNGARQDRRLVRRLALHPLDFSRGTKKAPRNGREDGLPGAAKNTGDDAWLVAPKRSEGGLFEN